MKNNLLVTSNSRRNCNFGAGVWLLSNNNEKMKTKDFHRQLTSITRSQPPVYLIKDVRTRGSHDGNWRECPARDMVNAKKIIR